MGLKASHTSPELSFTKNAKPWAALLQGLATIKLKHNNFYGSFLLQEEQTDDIP